MDVQGCNSSTTLSDQQHLHQPVRRLGAHGNNAGRGGA